MGMLREGYAADFIVLDRDVLTIPAEEIDQVKVEKTWIGGEQVYCRI
ncbi:MAG: amidohydrolase family protein [Firmicutes bacterium]|nr:amidohydrolase family protein [Bacillota bacterium]